ncbi:putative A-agglutinin anchorage subunit-like [Homarus americanus]|uniref:Putative A-agglutinin anchorage subunit-like n=1 Tax=Homarus americanus TaxID=6706 RepID=A0A8J5K1X5_HOMAM|nr:putative A-agglutinin anchorage subunit-like [Homarus americanus]
MNMRLLRSSRRASCRDVVCVLLLVMTAGGCVRGQTVPDVPCMTNGDCDVKEWTSPQPECISYKCRCPNDTCVVYTYLTDSNNLYYYCGDCGTLGSECNSTEDCMSRWQCSNNVMYSPVPTSVSSLVLIIILAILLIIQKLIHSRKTLKKCFCRKSGDSEEDTETRVVGYNPDSNNKTAAYTITNSDFMTTSDDPDFDWALELSRQMSTRGEEWLLLSSSTWSSLSSSQTDPSSSILPDLSSSQPGTSGWRPRSSSTSVTRSNPTSRPHRRRSTRSSMSSVSSTYSASPPPSSYYSSHSIPYTSSLPSPASSRSTPPSASSTLSSRRSGSDSYRSCPRSSFTPDSCCDPGVANDDVRVSRL